MRKHSIIILFLLSMIIGCTSCSQVEDTIIDMKVGTWKTAQTIQPFYYEQFVEENIDIEVLPFTNPGDQKSALLAKDLDICGTTLVTAIIAASKGEPIKIISNLTNKCSALVVAKESDIHSIEDLEGKTIAYVPGTMHHILLLETLQKAGLDPVNDVTFIRIDFFDMGQALAQGAIDAFCSGEPYPSIALKEEYGTILGYPYYDGSIGYINAFMITTVENIENHRDIIQKLVTAHVKATNYLITNQEEWLTAASQFGTDKEILKLSAHNIDLAWDITPQMIEQTQNLAERMKELGVITEVPDIEALFDLSFLEQARNDYENESK